MRTALFDIIFVYILKIQQPGFVENRCKVPMLGAI